MNHQIEKDKEFESFMEHYTPYEKVRREKLPSKSKPFKFDILKILKSIATTDISNISFPVFVNEPLSYIQRVVEANRYYDLLNKAADCKNVVDRLAYMAAFQISTCYTAIPGRSRKPFNPILGETFEYIEYENKFLALGEQVSHHPPITITHIQTDKFETTFNAEGKIKFQITKIKITWPKKALTRFKNDQQLYTTVMPTLLVRELSTNHTWTEYIDSSTVSHLGSKAHATIHYNEKMNEQTVHTVNGTIFNEEGKECGSLKGSYHTEVTFYNKLTNESIVLWKADPLDVENSSYFGFNKFTYKLNDPSYTTSCPTDSRFRPDVRLMEEGKDDEAESEKKRVEVKQRMDAKKLKHDEQTYSPKWFTLEEVSELSEKFYVYSGNYWISKLNNDFSKSPNIYKS